MADTVFNDGNSTGVWSDAANWTAGKPAAGESWQISADCSCDSDESAAVLGAGTVDAATTLTLTGVGKVYVSEADVTIAGTLALDGGTLRLTSTGATTRSIVVDGSITGTANCGSNDIELSSAQNTRTQVLIDTSGASTVGAGAGTLIHIVEVGAARGQIYLYNTAPITISYVHFAGLYRIQVTTAMATFTQCLIDDCYRAFCATRCVLDLDRCTISNNTSSGFLVEYASYGGYVRAKDCTFDGNTVDLNVDAGRLIWHPTGCMRPTTDIEAGATLTIVPTHRGS